MRLQLLAEAASELLKRSDPLQFLDSIYERICELVGLEVYFHFGALDGDADRLRLVAFRGVDSETAATLEWVAMGQAVCGAVAQTCSPLSVSNVQERSDEMTALIRDLGITSYICHPLTVRGKLLGTLSFGSRTRPSFSEHEVELIRALSDLVALALDRRDRDVALARQNVELRVLQELSHAVSQAAGVDEFCQAAVEALTERMAADRASVLIFDRHGVMRFRAWSGLSDEYRAAVDGHSPWGPETRNPDPVLIENVERADDLGELKPVILREGIRALGFFPLMGGGALQGKFMVYYDRPHVFAADEQEQLRTVAEQIGVRIERAGVQERLRESEARFRRAIERAPIPILFHTEDDELLTASDTVWERTGYRPEEIHRYTDWLKLAYGDRWEAVQAKIKEHFADNKPLEPTEFRLRTQSGEERDWIFSSGPPERMDDGRRYFVVMANDVTDLKRAHSELHQTDVALRASRERYRLINDALPVLITYINRDLVYEYCNAAYEKWFRLKPDEIIGRQVRDVVGEDAMVKMQPRLDRVFNGESVSDDEYVIYKNGVGRHIHIEYIPQKDESGEVVGFYALVENISERKRFEDELRQWNDQLEARIEERTEVVERQANQLRRLTMRLAKAEQVERRALAERIHGELQQLLTAALMRLDQMGKVVKDERIDSFRVQARQLILDATQEARSVTTQLSPPILHHAGLGAAIQWMADWMHQKYGLRVIVDVDESAEPDSDEVRGYLFEAARELLFNVVKHAGVNEARVSMKRADAETVIEIVDEGRGTDAELAIASHESDGGFGLFSLTERLQMAGCDVNIRTAPGEGFHTTIRIPRETFEAAAAESDTIESEARTECRDGLGEKAGAIRILVVDDHHVVREGLVTMLEEQADLCVVGEAATGRDAVNSARELRPDVILMDVNLPDFSGIQATREILAESDDVIIVALSVNDDEATRLAMREAGAADYLTKDSESDLIFETVRNLARRT